MEKFKGKKKKQRNRIGLGWSLKRRRRREAHHFHPSSMSLILLLAFLLVLASLLFLHRFIHRTPSQPQTWPLFGSLLELRHNFHRLHDWIYDHFSDETRTWKLVLPYVTAYFTVDPLVVEHILKSNFHNYPKGQRSNDIMYDFLGDGIFNADGETWKRHRKLASFEFSNRKLRDFSTDVFREDALKLVEIIQLFVDSKEPVDLQDLFLRMTFNSICKVGFGVDMHSLSPSLPDIPFGRAFDNINEIITRRFANLFWKWQRALNLGNEKLLKKDIMLVNKFAADVIEKRRDELQNGNQGRPDLLSRFMSIDQGEAKVYSDGELRDVIMNFVIAGRDTSAITLSWFIYCVCNHPDVADRIVQETVEVLDLQSSEKPTFTEVAKKIHYETLNKMHYLHAALTETLRLYPAVPRDGKHVLHDDILPNGIHVKKGNSVTYVPYSMGRMEFLWGKDALCFRPERWLKDGAFQPESPFKFSAFQAGPRICLGRESAYLQMKTTASLLLYFFRFQLVRTNPVRYRITLVMPMANGLLVHVHRRR